MEDQVEKKEYSMNQVEKVSKRKYSIGYYIRTCIHLIVICCLVYFSCFFKDQAIRTGDYFHSLRLSEKKSLNVSDIERYKKEVNEAIDDYTLAISNAISEYTIQTQAYIKDGAVTMRYRIPDAVEPYTTFKGVKSVVFAMVSDSFNDGNKLSELISDNLDSTIIAPMKNTISLCNEQEMILHSKIEDSCHRLAKQLDISVSELCQSNTNAQLYVFSEAEIMEIFSKAYGANIEMAYQQGLQLAILGTVELAFARSTIVALRNISIRFCQKVAAKTAITLGLPLIDGPLPIGDAIAVISAGFTIWDIFRIKRTMPHELAMALEGCVNDFEVQAYEATQEQAIAIGNQYLSNITNIQGRAFEILPQKYR